MDINVNNPLSQSQQVRWLYNLCILNLSVYNLHTSSSLYFLINAKCIYNNVLKFIFEKRIIWNIKKITKLDISFYYL